MLDLKEMGGRLSDEYQKPLSEGFRKRVELEFHSCIYSSLTEVITALRTVCDHLVKVEKLEVKYDTLLHYFHRYCFP